MDLVNRAQKLIAEKPVFDQALRHLRSQTEIRLLLKDGSLDSRPAASLSPEETDGERPQPPAGTTECEAALFFDADSEKACLAARPARQPDVEFRLSEKALSALELAKGDDMAEFGMDVIKQIAAGEIKVKVCGGMIGVMRNGYFGIIKSAGPSFAKHLASFGLSSVPKIVALIKQLRD